MYKTNKFWSLLGLLSATLSLWNCGANTDQKDQKHIKVGVSAGLEYSVAQVAQQVAKAKYGLDVELVPFNDYVVPNEALSQGDLDVNAFQHRPYLDAQSKQRGYKLAVVGKTFIYPIAGYSRKIKKVSELQSGSTIVIPNDPTNGGRSLLLLQKNGLLTLRANVGLLPKVTDITANPKNLKILELEAPQLTRVLDDKEVSIAIINNTFASQVDLLPSRDGLFVEDQKSPYVNLIVARQDNKNDQNVKEFVQAYQSAEVEQAAKKEFKGAAIKGW